VTLTDTPPLDQLGVRDEDGSKWTRRTRSIGLHLTGVVILLGTWIFVSGRYVSERVLPLPQDVVTSWFNLWSLGVIQEHAGITIQEAVYGFVLGTGLGLLCASGAALSSVVRRIVYPYSVALQCTPSVAFAPLLFIWLGFGMAPKIVLGAIIAFFPVFLNTVTGLLLIDEEKLELFQSLGASERQIFFGLRIPESLPMVFIGLKQAISTALIGAVVGEFVSGDKGLGVLISRYSAQLNSDASFAIILTLTIIGLLLFGAMEVADRFVVFWNHSSRLDRRSKAVRARAERRARRRRPASASPSMNAPHADRDRNEHKPLVANATSTTNGGNS
jgi:NitT/TauT family transport system permease protein